MKNNRQNLDLYYLGYKRASRVKYLLPMLFGVVFGAIGALIFFQIIPNIMMHEVYAYVLFGMAGILILISVLGLLFGRDRTPIPNAAQVSSYLAEDIESVRETMRSQIAPDFYRQDKKEFVVVNHCHEPIDGFRPYFKKDELNILHCSLNKITIFMFAPKRMQVFTSVVDMFTGIEIRQNSVKIPYANIYDCYIAYNSYLKPNSLRYEENTKKNSRLPAKLTQAVKVCKEVLRIKTRLKDEYNEQNTIQDSHDIMVADFEIYHTLSGIYKNIYSINDGKSIEKEILRRIGHGYIVDDEDFSDDDKNATDFHFVDDFSQSQSKKIHWN